MLIIREDNQIGVYIEHSRNLLSSLNYQLDPILFQINQPFFMDSERDALIRDLEEEAHSQDDVCSNSNRLKKRKRKKRNKNAYMEQLDLEEKKIINRLIHHLKDGKIISDVIEGDNEAAREKARTVEDFIPTLKNENDILKPKACSFFNGDVIDGLEKLRQSYIENKMKISNTHFMIIIDPPWRNKSVKRKKSYMTQDNEHLLEMSRCVHQLIQLIPNHVLIRIAIWTTGKDKEFAVNEMMSSLGCVCDLVLSWHKITTSGESVKVRGGLEYLVIGTRRIIDADITQQQIKPKKGVLISIPSAIHSHKPPISKLFLDNILDGNHSLPHEEYSQDKTLIIVSEDEEDSSQLSGESDEEEQELEGLELYARYLQRNFYSIGLECCKLQDIRLYTKIGSKIQFTNDFNK